MKIIAMMFGIFWVTATLVSLSAVANEGYGWIEGRAYLAWVMMFQGLGYSAVWAYYDSLVQIKGIHFMRSFYKLLLLAIIPFIIALQQSDISFGWLTLYSIATFGLVFDQLYNIFKGNPLWYIGTEALTDRIIRSVNKVLTIHLYPIWYILVKIIILIVLLLIADLYFL